MAERRETLAWSKMDAEPAAYLPMCHLYWIQVVAVASNDVDAIKGAARNSGNEIDAERHVDDLLLAIWRSVTLEEFKSGDVPVRALHCEESSFPRFVRWWSGVEASEGELVSASQNFNKWPQSRISEAGAAKGADEVTPINQNRYPNRGLPRRKKKTRRRFGGAGVDSKIIAQSGENRPAGGGPGVVVPLIWTLHDLARLPDLMNRGLAA